MTYDDIQSEILFLTNTDADSYKEDVRVRHLNSALFKVQLQIMKYSGVLTFDDLNYTDYPEATFDIVAGQQAYSLQMDDNNSQIWTIHKIAVFNEGAGRYDMVQRVPMKEPFDRYLEYDESTRYPTVYWEQSQSVFFHPIPDRDIQNGGKVWFDRSADKFQVGDGSKTPGFNEAFHMLLPVYVAQHYAIANNLTSTEGLQFMARDYEERLRRFYSGNRRDEQPRLVTRQTRSW